MHRNLEDRIACNYKRLEHCLAEARSLEWSHTLVFGTIEPVGADMVSYAATKGSP